MSTSAKKAPAKERLTIMQQASVPNVRDPAAHARHQVSELDKTAKASQLKRKQCLQAIEDDKKELEHIEDQINRLKQRYDPLCEQLDDKVARRDGLMKLLEQCLGEEKKIMADTKGTVQARLMDDAKLSSKMASQELETQRGYNMKPESTFHLPHLGSTSPNSRSKKL